MLQAAKWGMVAEDTEAPAGAAAAAQASASTWPSSTCTCRAWTAAQLAARIREAGPPAAAGAVHARSAGATAPATAVRRDPGEAAAPAPVVRHAGHAAGRGGAPAPRRRARPSRRSTPRWRHATRCASCSPRTTWSIRSWRLRLLQQMGYRADLASQRHRGGRVRRAPDLRRDADGRADARDGRAGGFAAHHRQLAARTSGRASSR